MGNWKCITLYALLFQYSSAKGRGKNCPQTLCDSFSLPEHRQAIFLAGPTSAAPRVGSRERGEPLGYRPVGHSSRTMAAPEHFAENATQKQRFTCDLRGL